MVAINMEMPKDCKKCPLMGVKGNPKDFLSPMMCIAIWATTHEIKYCVGGQIRYDCPLVEIGTCKDCEHWCHIDGYENLDTCKVTFKTRHKDYYCADFEKRGNENGR